MSCDLIVIVFIFGVGVVVADDDGVGGAGGVDLKNSWMIVMRFDCYCFYICCWCCFVVDVVVADAGVVAAVDEYCNILIKTFNHHRTAFQKLTTFC